LSTNNIHGSIVYRRPYAALSTWLEVGQCTSEHAVYLVLMDWIAPANVLAQQVEAQCPDLPRTDLAGGMVYQLP
ncbi:MAG: hypothetical protein HC893_04600, partial [Chloroflexaceae bacterium]|nr:hypothetical protein [Chloroflexaceae bacterium]